jgi:peptidylprolyl isomerase
LLKEDALHRRTLIASGAALSVAPLVGGSPVLAQTMDKENTLYMDLKQGRVVIRLLPDVAPKTVAQIKTLTRQGFYDGTPFHRVIDGFMAQGGDPTGTGTGGSKLPNVPLEASQRHFVRGVCGMARTSDPNSGNSQFFIMFAPAPSLDGQYTIWGQVISGMDYVDQIKRGAGPNGMVNDPDRIVHMRVAADVK